MGDRLKKTVRPMLSDCCLLSCLRRRCIVAKRLYGLGCHSVWKGGRPRSRLHYVRWKSSYPRNGHTQPPIFGPCLLWPNGWMDQDATWYGVGHGPGHIVLDGDPAPHHGKGHSRPHFSAHVYCDRTVANLSNC